MCYGRKKCRFNIIKEINTNEDKEYNNILIKGENLYALELLVEEYESKIDIIYIDPIYNDKKHYWYENIIREEGKDKHEAWSNFIEQRLLIVERLISNESIIFISVNDEEVYNLKILCDRIFKKMKFTCNFIWNKGATSSNNNKKNINICTEYILCYSTKDFKFNLSYKDYNKYKCNHGENFAIETVVDNRLSQLISVKGNKQYTSNVKLKNREIIEIEGSKFPQSTIDRYQNIGKIFVNYDNRAYYKSFAEEEKPGICYHNFLDKVGTYKAGTKDLQMLLDKKISGFHPKPVDLIKLLLEMSLKENSIILDFFAGSGTTAQAAIELNSDFNYKLKFILCTNNENDIFDEICLPRIESLLATNSNENLIVYEVKES